MTDITEILKELNKYNYNIKDIVGDLSNLISQSHLFNRNKITSEEYHASVEEFKRKWLK